MPLQSTSGAASYDAFGGGVAAVPKYIEDYFYTYLRPAQGGSITYFLPSGVDLYNNGGIVWVKSRNAGQSHAVMNPNFKAAGGKSLQSNTTAAFDSYGTTEFAVNSNNSITMANGNINDGSYTYVDWTFVKTPKFFDVVTYTGTGSARTVAHSLGSTPACIIVKSTSGAGSWAVYHRGVNGGTNPQNYAMTLNATAAQYALTNFWNDTAPTSSVFTVGAAGGETNETGVTYIAYVFAHNAGGFGLTGTDNVISCGSVTADGAGSATVNLGYEPQWLLVKSSSEANSWAIVDTMRGLPADGLDRFLFANSSAAESGGGLVNINATGFYANATLSASASYIYIAIRRGPMKVPTVGTSVYQGVARTGTSANATVTGAGFAPDLTVIAGQSNSSGKTWTDKLRGANKALLSAYTNAEQTTTDWVTGFTNTGFTLGADASGADYVNKSPKTYINWMFGRAPSFFDEVCYTGTGSNPLVLNHNLGIAPTTIIIKRRSAAASNNNWYCGVNMNASTYTEILLNSDGGGAVYSYPNWFVSAPTSTTFDLNGGGNVNQSGATYVAYLFATCPGVSKVGTYTGNGTTQTIDCGFGAGGVRFVLIKRTDSTGDWYTYDTARGMTVLTDPYLFLNTTDAEVATLGSVTTVSTGFALNSSILAAINISAGTYTFLAIA